MNDVVVAGAVAIADAFQVLDESLVGPRAEDFDPHMELGLLALQPAGG